MEPLASDLEVEGLPELTPAPARAMALADAGPVCLAFLGRGGAMETVSLDGLRFVAIGRAASCEVALEDPRVSRRHATIETVEGFHLLRDAKSANGTSLNGSRISRDTAFVLRPGDELVVGETRLLYLRGDPPVDTSSFELRLASAPESTYTVAELLRSSALDEGDATAELLRAFSGVTRAEGLARTLAFVARKLQAHEVAIFVPRPCGEGVELVASYPDERSTDKLADIALPIMASERGRIVRAASPASRGSETERILGAPSSAAVPLCHGERPIGVLAVERRHGACLDRSDLACLAALGEKLAAVLSLQDASENDTRLGVDD